jgi:hypothetical protein
MMAGKNIHAEWLGLVETSGPFLAPAVLEEVLPHGLDRILAKDRRDLRAAYDEWDEALGLDDPDLEQLHAAWIRMVLDAGLGFEEDVLDDGSQGVEMPSYRASTGEVVTPDFVLRRPSGEPLIFVASYAPDTALDKPLSRQEPTSPIERMKLLCRSQKLRVGLVTNGEQWALVNAPVDDTSGHTIWHARLWWLEPVTYRAFVTLLGMRRFFGKPEDRIEGLLERSSKAHHEVTGTLGEQVRRAVEVLVQALGRADEDRNGELLQNVSADELYAAGLSVMMRLVFLLSAEERQLLLLGDPVYDQEYAVSTLRAKLEEDADRYGVEVQERRYDAWSRLLALFRGVFAGIAHDGLRMPRLGGSLFDPDRYPFLEGRPVGTSWRETPASPLPIDNRTVELLLRALQVLEHSGGARQLSYRGLDVEQIGHVYEGLLEFRVERVEKFTLGLRGSQKASHPTISFSALEQLHRSGVSKAVTELATVTGRSKPALTRALKQEPNAEQLPALVHACGGDEPLARRLLPFASLMRDDSWGVPLVYHANSFAVVPSAGRRETGSHYTPRALTESIVTTTLQPIFERLGKDPDPRAILEVKVCDPAMGSGAFLVEACRQLADRLVWSWSRAEERGEVVSAEGEALKKLGKHDPLPSEAIDRLITARRLVAERCLYGVDRNPMAVDLAKLGLWLVTLAKGKPLGFLDHKLKHGDSLVGLGNSQMMAFHWREQNHDWGPLFQGVQHDLKQANEWRQSIGDLGEFAYDEKRRAYVQSEGALADARLVGDLCLAAFFGAEKDKAREELREAYWKKLRAWRKSPSKRAAVEEIVDELRTGDHPLPLLHWELKFPEVFDRANPGFDAIVGNPPFAGKNTVINGNREGYLDWLKVANPKSHGNADLVAHFFRRAFGLIRNNGTFGLIATNTVGQGDTRATGLRWICNNGGSIYRAIRRKPWPGAAAVVVSVVHVLRGEWSGPRLLDGRRVEKITAFLFHAGGHDDPHQLATNAGQSFQGSIVLGMGFTFDDTDKKGVASPIDHMHRLIEGDPKNAQRIFPYIGGKEINSSPAHCHHRYVINFGEMSEQEAWEWPDLMRIVEAKVKPERMAQKREIRKRYWWRFGEPTPALFRAIADLPRVLAVARVGQHGSFTFLPSTMVYSDGLIIFPIDSYAAFCALQSRPHEIWARFFGSSLEDRLRYTPSDCFETFPFPKAWTTDPALEAAGAAYYEYRAKLMVESDKGMTDTYNRFHDPGEDSPEIAHLRELHEAMDRAVLDAYGWDIPTACEFLLDYEVDDEGSGKKKPWRYRWPDEVHDEVLARLLDLNQQRYEKEQPSSKRNGSKKKAKGKKKSGTTKRGSKKRQAREDEQGELF